MGIPAMIHFVTHHAGITDPERGFRLIFSGSPFPGFNLRLHRMHTELGGTWYALAEMHTDDGQSATDEGLHLRGWLCPALFKYFTSAPEDLYVRVEDLVNEYVPLEKD